MKQKNKGLETRDVVKTTLYVCDNTSDTAIKISESKARLVYRNHMKYSSGERALSLLGFFITFLITVLTADFNDVMNILNSQYVLLAVFWLLTVVSGIATVVFAIKWFIDRKQKNENTFIDDLKGT